MMKSMMCICLFLAQLAFAETPGVVADNYETTVGRITIACTDWTPALESDWRAALEQHRLKEGLILDLRFMTGTCDAQIPKLLGYCFDEQRMTEEDAQQFRRFLNGANPYIGPLLLQISDTASQETAAAVDLFVESRPNTSLTTCDLDCRLSKAPLWHFREAMDRIRLRQQERMDQMFEHGK